MMEAEQRNIPERVAILEERLEQYWKRAELVIAESVQDRARLHQLLDRPRQTEALRERESLLRDLAAVYVRQDLYEARHRELLSLFQQAREQHERLKGVVARQDDRLVALEKGNATLLARYAVLGTLAVIVFSTVISVLIDRMTH